MRTIFEVKEDAITETPLLLFDCELADGRRERWSTHQVTLSSDIYESRVLRHNLFQIQTSADQGVDSIPKISLSLANADSRLSEIEKSIGWKGAKLTAKFVFYDLKNASPATEGLILFQGLVNPPDEITESAFTLTAINRLSMQRVLLPEVRIQRRCPWEFPVTPSQRKEAVTGEARGKYSRFFRCGYSPDIAGGTGKLNSGSVFESCGKTRSECEARGMFRDARRFGGLEFVPSSVAVRSYGEKTWHASAVTENQARYNDFVPLVYGNVWYQPPIVFARNDGNLTHMEVLLGMGEIESVIKVIVNDIEIPAGIGGKDMSATGWYNVVSQGNRTGDFNRDFTDSSGSPAGDPYGSMAYLSVVVPNRVNDGRTLPVLKALVQGLRLPVYGPGGAPEGERFTNNPVWILLDVLRRAGWTESEIDLISFARAAVFCDEEIETRDLFGNLITTARFQCNTVVQKRRSAADLIRGIRNSARLLLSYGAGGLLEVRVENSIALEQPTKPAWSNAQELLDNGWPSYEFGDGSSIASGVLRRGNGAPSVRLWSRSTADTPNCFTVEFQDAFNEYQQDSFTLSDPQDMDLAGQEITSSLTALGIANYDQAARLLKFNLDKSIQGNTYVSFDSTVRALGLRPGDLITLTYLKEGFARQAFRVLSVAPGLNYRTVTITAQIHRDAWYEDTNGQLPGGSSRREPDFGIGIPRPLLGNITDDEGRIRFELKETAHGGSDGGSTVDISAAFMVPSAPEPGGPAIPLISLAAQIAAGGTLAAGAMYYYAVSAVDSGGRESALSFVVRASIPESGETKSVMLSGLSFDSKAAKFQVYRGETPAQLRRIASDQAIAKQFADTGLPSQVLPAPDANYDHANFYWRMELQPEYAATIHSRDTIGNGALSMTENQYRGMAARITAGKGTGQERLISGNTANTVSLGSPWSIEPDPSSVFVIAEATWHFGASARTSPVQFEIPNRSGNTIQISGRAANVGGTESSSELSTLTRWVIGGAGVSDADVPPKPVFGIGLSAVKGGAIELSGVAFPDLSDTRTISAGTLILHYWDELAAGKPASLASAITAEDDQIELTDSSRFEAGTFVQIDAEVLGIRDVLGAGRYTVTRATHNSTAQPHEAIRPVYGLLDKVCVVPFARDFFGSPFSGNWSFPVFLPDARIASAEFYVTNVRGNSERASLCLTENADCGLRTASGGQFCIQLQGFLAVENFCAPDLLVDTPHTVRDTYAVVRKAPVGAPLDLHLTVDGEPYCRLTIADGSTTSETVSGFGLTPLQAGSRLNVNILSVGTSAPGSDLTVIIRL